MTDTFTMTVRDQPTWAGAHESAMERAQRYFGVGVQLELFGSHAKVNYATGAVESTFTFKRAREVRS